jgi:predicted dehydrogenase
VADKLSRVPTSLPIVDRPIRLAVVGLGQIAELMLPSYLSRDDVDVVAGCDRDPERLERWRPELPGAMLTTELDELLQVEADIIDVLVPTHLHAEVAVAVLDAGFHVQLQKPIARSAEDSDRILAAARRNGALIRILEDYVFFPPLVKLREIVRSGEIGNPVGLHMKVVNTGRGGWDILPGSLEWQFEQTRDGRGMLVFDHGWHQLAVAVWLFGPIRKIFGWIGSTEIVPGLSLDAPATLVWEHEGGLRGVLDITLAVDTYFKSEFYSCDERVEVTGQQGSVRCNRISSFGRQEPSIEVYREGEIRSFHAIDEGGDAGFAASTAHMVELLRGQETEPIMGGDMAQTVLNALLCGLNSAKTGATLDVPVTT